jgi:hypothetical protein
LRSTLPSSSSLNWCVPVPSPHNAIS